MSSGSISISSGISKTFNSIDLSDTQPTTALAKQGGTGDSSGTTKPGAGNLATRQISIGNGEARSDATSLADKTKSFFKTVGKVLAGIVLAPVAIAVAGAALATRAVLQIPRLVNQHVLEPRSDRAFEAANKEQLAQLRTPIEGSITRDKAAMTRLEKHAENMGTPLSKEALRDLVAVGERLAQGLASLKTESNPENEIDLEATTSLHHSGSPLTLDIDGKSVKVESSLHTTRALAWYMMAAAAGQDEARSQNGDKTGTSDMVSSGAFRMKDPGNNIHKFLSAAPTSAPRMSTHFAEVVDHEDKHKALGFIRTGKPAQRGIEDYRNQMPGAGGTMLFDKLTSTDGSKDLFVKFESVGCPPFFKKEPHQGVGQGIARFFCALDRNLGHATNFIHSTFQSGPKEGVVSRQEHVYKGTLKKDVSDSFASLLDKGIKSGVVDASAKDVSKSVHKFGLPFIYAALDQMEKHATEMSQMENSPGQQGATDMLSDIGQIRLKIGSAVNQLGLESDRHGVDRRGAEVHISMNPSDNSEARRL